MAQLKQATDDRGNSSFFHISNQYIVLDWNVKHIATLCVCVCEAHTDMIISN